MHGNELRRAGCRGTAVTRLQHAATLAPGRNTSAAIRSLLNREAGIVGSDCFFDAVVDEYRQLLADDPSGAGGLLARAAAGAVVQRLQRIIRTAGQSLPNLMTVATGHRLRNEMAA
ncbi:hypothetical protein AB8O64_01120 [Streptomyces sp. QH1-20]|uniref:hypothetical protein n=1 Tax=Streptomyces sp. QH1-20 TaxID=3240934 RepID=UPI0035139FED